MTGRNYKAWQIKAADFPKRGSIEDQINFLIGYGVLAPSTHNTQPWLFEVTDNKLLISGNPALKLPQADPAGRNLQISLGCCVANIEIAAAHFGLSVERKWGAKQIELSFKRGRPDTASNLIEVIALRYSDKLPYRKLALRPSHKKSLMAVKSPKGCKLSFVTDTEKIDEVADIAAAAVMSYGGNRDFFAELSNWLRSSKTKEDDGMPGFVVGLSNGKSKTLRVLIKKLKPAVKLLAKKDKAAVKSSSALGIITTDKNDASSWFEAGRYYETLALEATDKGLAMAPMMAIIEDSNSHAKLKKTLELSGTSQIFFRLGYSSHQPYHTPRRNPSQNLMPTQQRLINSVDVAFETKRIRVGKYDINYIVAGSGKPVVMLHGANIGWAQWYQNLAELAKHFKVYALDLPGAGNSTKVNFHKTDFEEDFVKIVDKFIILNKLTKVDIIGSSFGGWIAMRLAVQQKPYIRRIVLTNPMGFTTHMPIKFRPISIRPMAVFVSKTALKPVRKNKNLEKFMRDVFYDKNQSLAPEFIDYFYELSETSHNILFISRLAHFSGMRKELFLKDQLPQIKVPVMLLWGLEDQLMPFWSVKDNIGLIPGIRLKTLEKIGHMPPVEDPAMFNKSTIEFLE